MTNTAQFTEQFTEKEEEANHGRRPKKRTHVKVR